MSLTRTTTLLLRWHRRIGLWLVVAFLFLVITGLLINHTSGLGLARTHLTSSWLLDWYGIEDNSQDSPPVQGFKINQQQWLYSTGDTLYLNQQTATACQVPLHSAINFQRMILALCQDQLVLLDRSGQLLEIISTDLGLPDHAKKLGLKEQQLVLQIQVPHAQESKLLALDLAQLSTQPVATDGVLWGEPEVVPKNFLTDQTEQPFISLETLLLDLHSGRFFGTLGVLLIDIASLFMLLLALTGLWAWINHRKIIAQHNKDRQKTP